MAKSVKEKGPGDVEVTERAVKSMTKRVFEQLDNLETSKAQHMNRARRIREAMAVVYEGAAAEGIPQKVAKLHIKIIRTIEQVKKWMLELEEAQDQALARKMAKAQGNKVQLSLWAELPVLKVKPETAAEKKARAEAEKKAKDVASKDAKADKPNGAKNGTGATGQDIDDAERAAEAERIAKDAQSSEGPAPLLN